MIINRTGASPRKEISVSYPSQTYGKGTIPPKVANGAKVNTLIGVSTPFNQIYNPSNTDGSSYITRNDDGTITINGTPSSTQYWEINLSYACVIGHKYYLHISDAVVNGLQIYNDGGGLATSTSAISAATAAYRIYVKLNGGTTFSNVKARPVAVDITPIEQATGKTYTTVAQFLADYPEYAGYVPYSAGKLNDATITDVMSVGINLWDEKWEVGSINATTGQNETYSGTCRTRDYIPVNPSTSYYFLCSITGTGTFPFFAYDANKNFISTFNVSAKAQFTTPSNCYYIRFRSTSGYGATYLNDIQICLDSQPDKTTYHPYKGFKNCLAYRPNIWDESWEIGNIDISTGIDTTDSSNIRSATFCDLLPNTSYYYYIGYTTGIYNLCVYYYDANKQFISANYSVNRTLTSPANARYFRIATNQYGGAYRKDVQICLDSYPNKTSYHSHDYVEPLRSAGTVCDEYNPSTGVWVKRVGSVDLGSLTWGLKSGESHVFYSWGLQDIVKVPSSSSVKANIVCSKYITGSANESYSPATLDKAICVGSGGFVGINDSAYTDATAFKTAMSGVMLNYELATPTTQNLTPINTFIELEANGTVGLGHSESPSTASKFTMTYIK